MISHAKRTTTTQWIQPFEHILIVNKTTGQQVKTTFTCEFSGLILLFLSGRADVLRWKGWHLIVSLLCVFLSASVCRALCSLLKSGTCWMILGLKLGVSSRKRNLSFLVRSAVRSFGLPDTVEFSQRNVVWMVTSLQSSRSAQNLNNVEDEARSLHKVHQTYCIHARRRRRSRRRRRCCFFLHLKCLTFSRVVAI